MVDLPQDDSQSQTLSNTTQGYVDLALKVQADADKRLAEINKILEETEQGN